MSGPTRTQLQDQIRLLEQQVADEQQRAANWRDTAHRLSSRLDAARRRETRSWWRP